MIIYDGREVRELTMVLSFQKKWKADRKEESK